MAIDRRILAILYANNIKDVNIVDEFLGENNGFYEIKIKGKIKKLKIPGKEIVEENPIKTTTKTTTVAPTTTTTTTVSTTTTTTKKSTTKKSTTKTTTKKPKVKKKTTKKSDNKSQKIPNKKLEIINSKKEGDDFIDLA